MTQFLFHAIIYMQLVKQKKKRKEVFIMLEHTLTIGMNDKNTKKQEMTVEHAKMLISSVIGDCTIKEGATGYYT